jgi:acetyltransferase
MAQYPRELERQHILADGRMVTIRPIRPQDDAAAKAFFDRLSPQARRMRFMKWLRSMNSGLVHTLTHVDYEGRMAFVCEAHGGGSQIVGEARYIAVPRSKSCDFAIVIADDWHKSGIAGLLMLALMDYARGQGFERMESIVLRENRDMVGFARSLGFEVRPVAQEPTLMQVAKPLGLTDENARRQDALAR